jgi:transcriptional regulator with XRE-family HTH domain
MTQKIYLSEWLSVKGLTQKDLAEKSGIGIMTLSNITRSESPKHKPLDATLLKIALSLGLDKV